MTMISGMAASSRRLGLIGVGLLIFGAVALSAPRLSFAAGVFNIRTYGAAGNGSTNDTAAVQKAIDAANAAGGGTVEAPAGTYLIANSLHMKSNITLQLDSGSTFLGAGGTGYDAPEPAGPNNAWSVYQDAAHSHFHDAMIWGDGVSNVTFTGSGTIDGGGHFNAGNASPGQADKDISLINCSNVTLNGIKVTRGGHFGAILQGCDHITSDHFDVEEASDRDGWDVIDSTNVTITNLTAHGSDDGLAFKSDWALGRTGSNGPTTVTGANLSSGCCNALMFGSETCGDFTNFHFEGISISSAGKSGLGMVSSDGAHFNNINYDNIQMSGPIAGLLMEKVWNRDRCGTNPPPGSITNVHYSNITASTTLRTFSPTLWGMDATHNISDVTFDNVHFTLPGGGSGNPDVLPSNSNTTGLGYNPISIGTRPAYGLFMHNVDGILINNSSFTATGGDGRPATDVINGANVCLNGVTASPPTAHFNSVSGYTVSNSPTLNVTQVGSTTGGTCPSLPGPSTSPSPSPSPSCTPTMAPPSGLVGTAGGAGQLVATWNQATDCAGPSIEYAVYLYGADGSTQFQTATSPTFTFSGLTNQYYTFTVTAYAGPDWTPWGAWAAWALPG